jgi:hypothetical protein
LIKKKGVSFAKGTNSRAIVYQDGKFILDLFAINKSYTSIEVDTGTDGES